MSKLLLSYVNDLDAGTVTASSQHPSFPAINVQQRWYKKPWRSKYGAGSGWGLFRVTAANNLIYYGEQLLVNGTMESWASATDLNNWTETLVGTSTVNREGTIVIGTYSCRMDISAANDAASISQTVTLAAASPYRISLWHKTPVGKTGRVLIQASGGDYLQADGSWAAGVYTFILTGTGAWEFYTLPFTSHGANTSHTVSLGRTSAASASIYFDEVVLHAQYAVALTVGDYDSTTLCAEIKTRMDVWGTCIYTVTYSDVTNKFTISGSVEFALQFFYHTNTAWDLLGFSNTITWESEITVSITAPSIRVHSSEFLYLNAGSAKTIKFLSLKGHNLQSTAIITAHYYSDAFITLVASDIMTWHSDTISLRLSRSYQYVAFEISDPTNPNLYVEVGRAWVGDELVLHYGFNPEHSFAPQDPSVISSSDDGQESSIQRTHFAEWNYVFDAVTPADRVSLAALFLAIGFSMPCFIVEAPPVSGDLGLLAKYIKFTEWEEPHLAGSYWSMEVAVRTER